MSHFGTAIEIVLAHEGGLVNHPDDPGGVTNFGISLRWALQQHIQAGDSSLLLLDVDGDGDVDADDIRAMPRATAKQAYLKGFWKPGGYDRINDAAIATKVFDMAVNMGARQAHKLAQRAQRSVSQVVIADDGRLGPISIERINSADELALMAALRSEQAGFYRALIIRNDALRKLDVNVPDFSKFKNGWLRRAYA